MISLGSLCPHASTMCLSSRSSNSFSPWSNLNWESKHSLMPHKQLASTELWSHPGPSGRDIHQDNAHLSIHGYGTWLGGLLTVTRQHCFCINYKVFPLFLSVNVFNRIVPQPREKEIKQIHSSKKSGMERGSIYCSTARLGSATTYGPVRWDGRTICRPWNVYWLNSLAKEISRNVINNGGKMHYYLPDCGSFEKEIIE